MTSSSCQGPEGGGHAQTKSRIWHLLRPLLQGSFMLNPKFMCQSEAVWVPPGKAYKRHFTLGSPLLPFSALMVGTIQVLLFI